MMSWKRRAGVVTAVVAVLSTGLVAGARAVPPGPNPPACGKDDLPETGLQGDVPVADRAEGTDGVSRAERGYNCGLALVGHTTLDGVLPSKDPKAPKRTRNPSSNANMAWSQDCAYVAGPGTVFGPTTYDAGTDDPNGVAVIDVSDPAHPVQTKTLIGTPASTKVSETINAVDAPARGGYPARHLLVVGQYGNAGSGALKPMDIYDLSDDGHGHDCAHPRLIETYAWQENIHNLSISGNGKYVIATQPLQMIDIDPLFDKDPATDATYLGDVERDMPYPVVGVNPGPTADDSLPAPVREANRNGYSAHQAWSSFDGTRLYLGAQTPQYEVFTIVDITKWLNSKIPGTPVSRERPEVLSQEYGRGHSVSIGRIAGTHDGRGGAQTWALHSEESVFGQADDCTPGTHTVSPNYGLDPFVGVAEPFLSNVSDPAKPEMHVSRLGLAINRPENCTKKKESGVQASVHYHDFDNEGFAGTSPTPDVPEMHFAILSMQNAGIRVWDVRHPASPREVAYFNPGDVNKPKDDPSTPQNEAADNKVTLDYAWAHSRYVPETHQLWFTTRAGGFWVVELEKKFVDYFFGPQRNRRAPVHRNGSPGTAGVAMTASLPSVDVDPMYCTLGTYLRSP